MIWIVLIIVAVVVIKVLIDINDAATPPTETQLAEQKKRATDPTYNPKKKCCPKCGSENITYDIITDRVATKGTSEVRKKNAVTRAANSTGRAAMTMATGGLWLLTPKKSKYHEIKKEKTKVINRKVAICQDCGADWMPLF